ncbi:MBOAT family O-acyltransferase [Hyphobacterium sp.]|uniref:MBOAT family O-acyltransferase n=1 Tax=Hyphobacterium sp. TaxID=2004662 RepID=UPI003BACC2F2
MLQADLISGLPSIPAASPQFLAIAGVAILLAQFRQWRLIPFALALGGALIAISWASQIQFILLMTALVSNFLILQVAWGQSTPLSRGLVKFGVAWHVLLLGATKVEAFAGPLGLVGTIGISYLTFRQIQLLLIADRAREPLNAALWLSFLINPLTLIAGPIQTWEAHLKDMAVRTLPGGREWLDGLQRITTGALKILVLAPIFAGQSDFAALAAGEPTATDLTIALYSYYIFLFLDFSGYIDIVVGLSRLLGFKAFPENFNRPYLAVDFQDFWNRWNMTLGHWFKTFLFTPLLVQLTRTFGPKRQNLAIMTGLFITFFLIGLWHGIAWNFIVFGFIQAAGVSLTHLARSAMIKKYGRKRFNEMDNQLAGRIVRIIIFQHMIAASFLFLDNDVGNVLAVL